MNNPHRRFLLALAGYFGATLLPIFILNFYLRSSTLGNSKLILAASQWQEQSRGTTFAGGFDAPDGHRLFKTLRLHDRLPEINTVVLGSSTVMGITQKAFPKEYRIFNFATFSNPLVNVMGEAEFIQENFLNVKWFVIPLECLIGFLNRDVLVASRVMPLSPESKSVQSEQRRTKVSLLDMMRNAVSYEAIINLFRIMQFMLVSSNKWLFFQENFVLKIGNEYVCPDSARGKDFDPMYRGLCAGFRFDGSITFAEKNRVGDNAPSIIREALVPGSIFSEGLNRINGVTNPTLLERLVAIDKRARQNGGGVIFIRPPMLPGVEVELLQQLQGGSVRADTIKKITMWAERNQLKLIDASQADRFGCAADEFCDAHHAVDTCYTKIFDVYFARK